jgi:hypothetical protein
MPLSNLATHILTNLRGDDPRTSQQVYADLRVLAKFGGPILFQPQVDESLAELAAAGLAGVDEQGRWSARVVSSCAATQQRSLF